MTHTSDHVSLNEWEAQAIYLKFIEWQFLMFVTCEMCYRSFHVDLKVKKTKSYSLDALKLTYIHDTSHRGFTPHHISFTRLTSNFEGAFYQLACYTSIPIIASVFHTDFVYYDKIIKHFLCLLCWLSCSFHSNWLNLDKFYKLPTFSRHILYCRLLLWGYSIQPVTCQICTSCIFKNTNGILLELLFQCNLHYLREDNNNNFHF